jgi:hypothetical protein
VQPFDRIRGAGAAPLAWRQTREGEQPVAGFFQAVGHGVVFEPPLADEGLAAGFDLLWGRRVDHVGVIGGHFVVQALGRVGEQVPMLVNRASLDRHAVPDGCDCVLEPWRTIDDEANRRNALKSTGPRTEAGKEQSHQNALRHGLTAETVIARVEDLEDYKAFEATIIADYDPETAVERELVLRLASLSWRSRRAILIETGLFTIQAEIVRDRRRRRNGRTVERRLQHPLHRFINGGTGSGRGNGSDDHAQSAAGQHRQNWLEAPSEEPVKSARLLIYSFLRPANLESGAFERLNRYEVALWRQAVQTIVSLRAARRRW